MGVEIEKKFLVRELPKDLNRYPFHVIEQGYLNVHPAIRVRREDDIYYMTYKGDLNNKDEEDHKKDEGGKIGKTEYNMPLDAASYEHMVSKADGNIIYKKRYLIPINKDAYTPEYIKQHHEIGQMMDNGDIKIELDVFEGLFEGRIIAEIEFPDEDAARNYRPADWFGEEVTGDRIYTNAYMSTVNFR